MDYPTSRSTIVVITELVERPRHTSNGVVTRITLVTNLGVDPSTSRLVAIYH